MKWYKYDIQDLTDGEYNKWYSLMSEEKQHRVDRFRFIDDKKRTVTGEMLARKAVAEWCNVASESIAFGIKEHGKPYAIDLPVEFNISHSGDIVVCAVDDKPVGIDVEQIRPIDLTIAKRFCSEQELESLVGHPLFKKDFAHTTDMVVLTRFFDMWTRKEAYGKYIGDGLFTRIDSKECTMQTYRLENYCVCICYEPSVI